MIELWLDIQFHFKHDFNNRHLFLWLFRYILDKRSNLQKPFLHLTRHCAAVLCCRATPLQKAFIVKIVKQQLQIRTLGIGIFPRQTFPIVIWMPSIESCLSYDVTIQIDDYKMLMRSYKNDDRGLWWNDKIDRSLFNGDEFDVFKSFVFQGDGANDVSMIQTADVGIGISGAEGMQAVMASDFAIPRFSFLLRLLLVHGHWCYDRLARMVLYFFFKNAVSIATQNWEYTKA